MPFCHLKLESERPLPTAYPRDLRTIGDHIRKRRLDLGLRQKDVAAQIGVTTDTAANWELGRTEPALRYMPAVIDFLGYLPFSPGTSFPERLKAYRTVKGLSQKRLAKELGVDPSTVRAWEAGKSRPTRRLRTYVERIVEDPDRF